VTVTERVRTATSTAFVVGTPFSGATTLAWAIAQHPRSEPVIGAGADAALRVIDDDLPLLEPFLGPTGRTLVVAGPDIAQRRRLVPEAAVIHVRRAMRLLDEAIWRRIEADCVATSAPWYPSACLPCCARMASVAARITPSTSAKSPGLIWFIIGPWGLL